MFWTCVIVVFENSLSCGKFVKSLSQSLSEDEKELLIVNGPNGSKMLVIDSTVYRTAIKLISNKLQKF